MKRSTLISVCSANFLLAIFATLLLVSGPKDEMPACEPQQIGYNEPSYELGSHVIFLPPCRTPYTPEAHKQEQHFKEKPFMTGGEFVISAITAIYAFFSIKTYYAIKRQAEISAETVKALMSAEQGVMKIISPSLLSVREGRYQYRLANVGKTVATVFCTHGALQVGSTEIQPPNLSVYDFPSPSPAELIIEPDTSDDAGYIFAEEGDSITDEDWKGVNRGNQFLWAYGFFRYRDIFGRPFTQRYCFLWKPTHGFIPAGPWECRRLI